MSELGGILLLLSPHYARRAYGSGIFVVVFLLALTSYLVE